MKDIVTQTQQHEQPSGIFGLRYLEEEELTLADVIGCQGVVGIDAASAGSFTIRLCGDGGDTDFAEER